jgi:hypothetical protein
MFPKFYFEIAADMVPFVYVGYRHEANVLSVDVHLHVDYDYY